MQLVRYLVNYFHCPAGTSEVKYAAGSFQAATEETLRHVVHGHAELVDAPADAQAAAQAADKATSAAEKAVERAAAANTAADAAQAAADLAPPAA